MSTLTKGMLACLNFHRSSLAPFSNISSTLAFLCPSKLHSFWKGFKYIYGRFPYLLCHVFLKSGIHHVRLPLENCQYSDVVISQSFFPPTEVHICFSLQNMYLQPSTFNLWIMIQFSKLDLSCWSVFIFSEARLPLFKDTPVICT